jgi:colicin import membrane protein
VTILAWDSSTLQEEHSWGAFAISALAHIVLLVGLIWGVRISSQTPAVVQAELWSSLPQQAVAPVVEPTQALSLPKFQAEPTIDPENTPDIVLEKNRPVSKKTEPVKTEIAKISPTKDFGKYSEQQKKQEQERKKIQEERLRTERFNQDIQSLMAGAASVNASPKGDAHWITRTAARIRANAIFNAENVDENPAVEYAVDLDPAGGVISVRKLRASGLPGFDEAVERAIRKSEPFAPDSSGKVPRNFVIQHRLRD